MIIKQVWVMWSAADLGYKEDIEKIAFNLWKEIAKNGYTLVYGAEKDCDSLSATAARGAKSVWWITVGVTYGNTPDIRWDMRNYTDVIINTGMQRWGWREFVLVSSCDAVVVIWWWSGTLNEMTIAYQKKIPIICIQWTWWWASKLADTYIDERFQEDKSRFICKGVNTTGEVFEYLNNI